MRRDKVLTAMALTMTVTGLVGVITNINKKVLAFGLTSIVSAGIGGIATFYMMRDDDVIKMTAKKMVEDDKVQDKIDLAIKNIMDCKDDIKDEINLQTEQAVSKICLQK